MTARQLARIARSNQWASGQRVTWRDRRRLRAELSALTASCRCGCSREWHEHYHAGTYCGRCGHAACPGWRRAPRKINFPWRRA